MKQPTLEGAAYLHCIKEPERRSYIDKIPHPDFEGFGGFHWQPSLSEGSQHSPVVGLMTISGDPAADKLALIRFTDVGKLPDGSPHTIRIEGISVATSEWGRLATSMQARLITTLLREDLSTLIQNGRFVAEPSDSAPKWIVSSLLQHVSHGGAHAPNLLFGKSPGTLCYSGRTLMTFWRVSPSGTEIDPQPRFAEPPTNGPRRASPSASPPLIPSKVRKRSPIRWLVTLLTLAAAVAVAVDARLTARQAKEALARAEAALEEFRVETDHSTGREAREEMTRLRAEVAKAGDEVAATEARLRQWRQQTGFETPEEAAANLANLDELRRENQRLRASAPVQTNNLLDEIQNLRAVLGEIVEEGNSFWQKAREDADIILGRERRGAGED